MRIVANIAVGTDLLQPEILREFFGEPCPMRNAHGRTIGHLAVLHMEPLRVFLAGKYPGIAKPD